MESPAPQACTGLPETPLDRAVRRGLVIAAEILLVLCVLGLLLATWMPALVGAQPWYQP